MRMLLSKILSHYGFIDAPRYSVRYTQQHPKREQVMDREFVIVRADRLLKWACFRCPCGCGNLISLALTPDKRPSWSVRLDWLARPSVWPSVWQKSGCWSHFWIKKGQILYCPDSGISSSFH